MLQVLSLLNGSIDCGDLLSKMVARLRQTSITSQTIIAIESMTYLARTANLLSVIEGPIPTIVRMQCHVQLVLVRLRDGSLPQRID